MEQLNQTNLGKLTLQKQLKIRENLCILDRNTCETFETFVQVRNTTSERSQQRIEQNIVPYYPIFRKPTQ